MIGLFWIIKTALKQLSRSIKFGRSAQIVQESSATTLLGLKDGRKSISVNSASQFTRDLSLAETRENFWLSTSQRLELFKNILDLMEGGPPTADVARECEYVSRFCTRFGFQWFNG